MFQDFVTKCYYEDLSFWLGNAEVNFGVVCVLFGKCCDRIRYFIFCWACMGFFYRSFVLDVISSYISFIMHRVICIFLRSLIMLTVFSTDEKSTNSNV